MKKKLGTIMDEKLVFMAKQVALSQRQPLSRLMEDALKSYLQTMERKKAGRRRNISQATHGVMKIPKDLLKVIMEEEGIYEAG